MEWGLRAVTQELRWQPVLPHFTTCPPHCLSLNQFSSHLLNSFISSEIPNTIVCKILWYKQSASPEIYNHWPIQGHDKINEFIFFLLMSCPLGWSPLSPNLTSKRKSFPLFSRFISYWAFLLFPYPLFISTKPQWHRKIDFLLLFTNSVSPLGSSDQGRLRWFQLGRSTGPLILQQASWGLFTWLLRRVLNENRSTPRLYRLRLVTGTSFFQGILQANSNCKIGPDSGGETGSTSW